MRELRPIQRWLNRNQITIKNIGTPRNHAIPYFICLSSCSNTSTTIGAALVPVYGCSRANGQTTPVWGSHRGTMYAEIKTGHRTRHLAVPRLDSLQLSSNTASCGPKCRRTGRLRKSILQFTHTEPASNRKQDLSSRRAAPSFGRIDVVGAK